MGQQSSLEGTTLQNRYHLNSQLGRGGMGAVYRAQDTLLHRDVAVKVLSDTALGSDGRARLLHEAQAAAKLNHPNIVSVYDAGEAELLIALARFDEAQVLLQEFDSQHFIYGIESYHRMQVDILRTEIAVAKGDPSAVELTALLEGKITRWDRRSLAWAKRAAGSALTRAGDFENAEKKLREALELFKRLDTPWQQGRTLVALGELSRARGDPLQARDDFTRALALFDAMEARHDAEKARGLLKNLETNNG